MLQLSYFCMVFLLIILLLSMHKPLSLSIAAGLLFFIFFFHIPIFQSLLLFASVFTQWSSLSILLTLYLVTFLQKIMVSRRLITLAQQDLSSIFCSQRTQILATSLFIGSVPSPASILLSCEIVKEFSDKYLTPEEQAFTASWLRHIPESILPTYMAVMLMLNLSDVPTFSFFLGMIPPIIVLTFLGYSGGLHKIPKLAHRTTQTSNRRVVIQSLTHLWPFIILLSLVLFGNLDIVLAAIITILSAIMIYRIHFSEIKMLARTSVECNMLVNTFFVLAFSKYVAHSGVLELIPIYLSSLPLPMWLLFSFIFFFITAISGAAAAITIAAPLAFNTFPSDIPLMICLMCFTHAASQISPTHTCLTIASDFFHIPFIRFVRKTMPRSILFCLFASGYFCLLRLV